MVVMWINVNFNCYLPQFSSSLLSGQWLCPSHTRRGWIQCPLLLHLKYPSYGHLLCIPTHKLYKSNHMYNHLQYTAIYV